MTQPLACAVQNKLYLRWVTTVMRKRALDAAILPFELTQTQPFPEARSLSTASTRCNQPLIDELLSRSPSADILHVVRKLNRDLLIKIAGSSTVPLHIRQFAALQHTMTPVAFFLGHENELFKPHKGFVVMVVSLARLDRL